jgi:cytochrome c2
MLTIFGNHDWTAIMIKWRSQMLIALRRRCGAGFFLAAFVLAGCGTMVSPVMQLATATSQVDVVTVHEATATMPPTHTALPPTQTPQPLPTETDTPAPSATPEPTTVPAQSPIDRLVAVRDAENGAVLFETFQEAANYACSNCHLASSEKTNLGPGLLNIKDRASTRIEGMTAAEYIYQSIVDSKAYTVEDFDPELMPQNWAEIYSDLEIFDIVAYLMTLEGRSDIDDPDPAPAEATSE